MSAILKDVLTMQEFRKLMDDDKWVKDFANAGWNCDKYGKRMYMRTVSYPIEYKVSEQQKRWAQTIRDRRKREELERIKPGELVFVAMGCDYDAEDPDEVKNHRMRTEFITDYGIKVFVEFIKGCKDGFWCDFSIHRTREEQMKHQDRVLGEQAKVCREQRNQPLYLEMHRRMGEQNYYNYMGVEKTHIDKPYTWTNVLEFVNRTYGTHFTLVRMDRYFLTTDDFVCRESAEWKRRVKVNEDADFAMVDKPLRIFCMGGYPHIALCTYETAHRGGGGYDYASIAHIIDGKPKWLDDADLLTEKQRKEVIDMCKRYTK